MVCELGWVDFGISHDISKGYWANIKPGLLKRDLLIQKQRARRGEKMCPLIYKTKN